MDDASDSGFDTSLRGTKVNKADDFNVGHFDDLTMRKRSDERPYGPFLGRLILYLMLKPDVGVKKAN
jgi:hypothetical protein